MRLDAGQVAVVSGAGSGIGRALVMALTARGLQVAAADIRLEAAQDTVAQAGPLARAYSVDVSDLSSMQAVADAVECDLGPLDLVVNNAGVAMHGKPIHELSMAEWDWVIGVNLYGVIHGIKTFVPRLLARGRPTHLVNTGSVAGFQVNPDFLTGAYSATKSAVVALSEALELENRGSTMGVSVLCPAAVNTGIHLSERARPERLGGAYTRPENHFLGPLVEIGQDPRDIAQAVIDGVEGGRFYLMTHPETRAWLRRRFDRILNAYPDATP
jgi:NAD(P)-dependent dehydrogenase (short-subunit alcohol dehydrogenase family)